MCLGLVHIQLRGGVEASCTWRPSQRLFGWTWYAGCMALGVLDLGHMDNCSAWDRRHGTTCTECGATTRPRCERSNCGMLQFLLHDGIDAGGPCPDHCWRSSGSAYDLLLRYDHTWAALLNTLTRYEMNAAVASHACTQTSFSFWCSSFSCASTATMRSRSTSMIVALR